MGLLSRIRALALALLALILPLLVVAPAEAAACSGTTGVTVIVQFPDNHIEVGCAPGDPSSGLAALKGAGFDYAFVPNQPGAVCRINGQPSSGPCWQPPDSWSYWYAERGGSWVYSNYGAGNRDPKPGTVEGWVFGTKEKPAMAPPPAAVKPTTQPSAKPTKKPTRKPTKKPPKPSVAPAGAATPTASASATPSTSASTSASASASESAATSSASPTAGPGSPTASTPSAGPSTTGDLVGSSAATDSADPDDSGGLSWIWGVGLLVLLAAGGVVAVVRRKG